MPGAVSDVGALFAPLRDRGAVALAVSGGADSLALLLLSSRWAAGEPLAPRLIVYSVDHGLRAEAADEVRFVCATAAAMGIESRPVRWEGQKPNTGVQAAARQARYRLMGEAMQTDGAELLLTGHHAEDQAETLLMRLAHGSGVEGLRGMARFATVEGCRIFRPLLEVSREALRAEVNAAGLRPVEDPSNSDLAYERVRWRRLLPDLAEVGLTPARLANFARRMGELDELVETAARAARQDIIVPIPGGGVDLDQRAFAALSPPVRSRLLGDVLAQIGDERKRHALSAVEALASRLVDAVEVRRMSLHGCLIEADGKAIRIVVEPGRQHRAEHPP